MSTLYYSNEIDNDWNTIGNWFLDSAKTTPAASIPQEGDDVIILKAIDTPPTDPISLSSVTTNLTFINTVRFANITSDQFTFNSSSRVFGSFTGNATFNGTSANNGEATGEVVFNGTSVNESEDSNDPDNFPGGKIIGGPVIFNTSSINRNSIEVNVTFNDSSKNQSNILGDVTFNTPLFSHQGEIEGNVVISKISNGELILGTDEIFGPISGTIKGQDDIALTSLILNDNANVYSNLVLQNLELNDVSIYDSSVECPMIVLNDLSHMGGNSNISGDVITLNGESYIEGSVSEGNVDFKTIDSLLSSLGFSGDITLSFASGSVVHGINGSSILGME